MLTQRARSYIFFPAAALLAGGVASFLTRDYFSVYKTLNQPAFAPPAWLFPVVWTVLYLLMGIGAARVSQKDSPEKENAILLFAAQLVINVFWPIIFFVLQNFVFACIWLALLLVLVIGMTIEFGKVDRTAALLQIPYILWSAFALVLNFVVAGIN